MKDWHFWAYFLQLCLHLRPLRVGSNCWKMAWPLWTPRGSCSKRRPCRSSNEKLVKWPWSSHFWFQEKWQQLSFSPWLCLSTAYCSVHVALLKELRTAVLDNNILLVVEKVFMSHLSQIIKLITVGNYLISFINHELDGKCESIQSMIFVGSSS